MTNKQKNFCTLILCLSILLPLQASVTAGAAVDAGLVQDFIFKTSSYNLAGDLRCSVTPSFEARVPFEYVWSSDGGLFDIGVALHYYPIEKIGLFCSVSLIQLGFSSPKNLLPMNEITLNEISLGYTYRLKNGFFVEPEIAIRDPSGTFSDEYDSLEEAFPCYGKIRARLKCGYSRRFEFKTKRKASETGNMKSTQSIPNEKTAPRQAAAATEASERPGSGS